MRAIFAGLIVLAFATTALAQVEGEVESIGIQGYFRPDCWTPMVVRLKARTGDADTYQIQVVQEDLDRDRPIFTRMAAMEGAREGQGAVEKRFWVYFIPQPTDGGMADSTRGGTTLRDLQDQLKVFLCTADGKQLKTLPVTQLPASLDPAKPPFAASYRGTRCILVVTEGIAQPLWMEYKDSLGLNEDVVMIPLHPRDLPESILGYDAIDGVLWLNADPSSQLVREDKLPALQAYVRQGGRLVVCQIAEWRKTLALADLLPVSVTDMGDHPDLGALKALLGKAVTPQWDQPKGPFKIALAAAKPKAVADAWVQWPKGTASVDRTPYLARWTYGLGAVTWVAQDLSDPVITAKARTNWPMVWDRVFDWRNNPIVVRKNTPEATLKPYAPSDERIDLGRALLNPMNHGTRSASLVLLAIVFFAIYWLVSGPGAYVFLASRKRSQFSWFAFAAAALIATGVTMLVVKVVLRGPPQIRHVSIVRQAPGTPTVVESRMGVYIPRDGEQRFELKDTAPGTVSFITAFPRHPLQEPESDSGFPAYMEYQVPVHDAATNDAVVVRIPYRSTLKKLQARWVGEQAAIIEGTARLVPNATELEGRLANTSGRELRNVCLIYNYVGGRSPGQDRVLYLPTWEKDATIDLAQRFAMGKIGKDVWLIGLDANSAAPGGGKAVRGVMEREDKPLERRSFGEGWVGWWYRQLPRSRIGGQDLGMTDLPVAFPMLSVFDHLPPSRARIGEEGGVSAGRFELLRRGARGLDLSHAVSAGSLLVLAESAGPPALPLEVAGRQADGQGAILYQVVLPLDRSEVEKDESATTRPIEVEKAELPRPR